MTDTFDLNRFLPFRLNRLAAEVAQQLAQIYSERFGLDIPQWRVLATLAGGQGVTARDIVASTRTHKSTISRAVQELEDRRLIERSASTSDGRAHELSLTAEGRRLFRQLRPLVLDFEARLLEDLMAPDARALLRGVAALEAALGLGKMGTT